MNSREQIYQLLKANPGYAFLPIKLMEKLDLKRSIVQLRLKELYAKGIVKKKREQRIDSSGEKYGRDKIFYYWSN